MVHRAPSRYIGTRAEAGRAGAESGKRKESGMKAKARAGPPHAPCSSKDSKESKILNPDLNFQVMKVILSR